MAAQNGAHLDSGQSALSALGEHWQSPLWVITAYDLGFFW